MKYGIYEVETNENEFNEVVLNVTRKVAVFENPEEAKEYREFLYTTRHYAGEIYHIYSDEFTSKIGEL